MEDTLTLTGGIVYSPEITVFFDVITQHSVQINDNITDNWLENSTVVNDCIAEAPIIVSLSGVSGELVYTPADFLKFVNERLDAKTAGLINTAAEKLGALTALYPPVDNITQTAINIKDAVMGNIDRFKKIYHNVKDKKDETRLEQIYKGLLTARAESKKTGVGFTVITPFERLDNMFIQSVTLSQENILHAADIQITLKQINFSAVTSQQADKKVYAEFNANARAAVENQGKVSGTENTALGQFFVNAGYNPQGGVKRN